MAHGRTNPIPLPSALSLDEEHLLARCRTTRSRWHSRPSSSTPARRLAPTPSAARPPRRVVPVDFHVETAGRLVGLQLQTFTITRTTPCSVCIRGPAWIQSVRLSHWKIRFIAAASARPQKLPNRVSTRRAWSAPHHLHQVFAELCQGIRRMQHQSPAVQIKPPLGQVHQFRKVSSSAFIGHSIHSM